MNIPTEPSDPGDYRPEDPPPPDPNCGGDMLDDYTCAAKGIEAQAAYNAAHLQALDTARTQYKGIRKAYGAAWDAAAPLAKEAGKQLGKLIEQLQCLIDHSGTVRKLDRAFDRVEDRLERCGDQSGCYCDTDCDFDDQLTDCPPQELAARIADIEWRTKEAEACFADLIQEPTKLTERVTAVQAEIADIATKTSGNPETTDFRRLYAAALVARRHSSAVRRGFVDVNAYVDCICEVLACMLKGHAAIAELKRREAVAKCHEDAGVAACTLLRTNTVDEVMAEYLRLQDEYGPDDGGGPGEYVDQRPAPYGDQPAEQDGDERPEPYGDRGGSDRYGGDRERDRYRRPDERDHGKDDRYRDEDRNRYGDRPRATGAAPR
ncbi:hypothetical protein GCM10027451_16100 [Geodermatophilus aquaeductus]|uniref:Uncharacterized protein n=1 Tax=Geodermatophilus aquaeductus TaxID=1564161 RepID=A0A521DYY8_9ACTN|nr:hypothetical protein [Geodermatophilus aquaeductus]SMO76845.1 hypothetical protein SAMN06273567_10429 [Geodermatophilus aquaeductus]